MNPQRMLGENQRKPTEGRQNRTNLLDILVRIDK
jgi:hypothetical protein